MQLGRGSNGIVGKKRNDRQRGDKVEENRLLEEAFSQRGTGLLYGLGLMERRPSVAPFGDLIRKYQHIQTETQQIQNETGSPLVTNMGTHTGSAYVLWQNIDFSLVSV